MVLRLLRLSRVRGTGAQQQRRRAEPLLLRLDNRSTWTIFKCFLDLYILNDMSRFLAVFCGFQKATFFSKDRTTLMVLEIHRSRLLNVWGGDRDY